MATDAPIIVTDTDDLQRMFAANISGWFAANGIGLDSSRLAASLIEILRANCPTPPNLVDALDGELVWIAGYSDGDGNMRNRAAIESDPELYPVTEVEV